MTMCLCLSGLFILCLRGALDVGHTSTGKGLPHFSREGYFLVADCRGVSSKYGVRLHFDDASVCEVGVDVCSERGILECRRKGVV